MADFILVPQGTGRNLFLNCLPCAPKLQVAGHSRGNNNELSTINTYIHLSILCYSLNTCSSQIELNYFTECLPYTAHPTIHCPPVTRTTRDHSDAIFLPVARFPRAGCVSNILSLISLFRVFGGSTQKTDVSFSKELLSQSYIECFNFRSLLQGTEKFAFCSDTFVSKFRVFISTHPPARSFLLPRFPPAGSAEPTAQYAHALLAAYSF